MAKRKYDTEQWAEQAAPSTPPANFAALYVATDHSLHIVDSTGANNTVGGSSKSYATRTFAVQNFQ